MIDCDSFHETKRERKYYEDKKQKALRYAEKMINNMSLYGMTGKYGTSTEERQHWVNTLKELKAWVNDI